MNLCVYMVQADESKSVRASLDEAAQVCYLFFHFFYILL